MEADSQAPQSLPSYEAEIIQPASESIGWANIFYGILIAPATTLNVLANSRMYKPERRTFLAVLATVSLCGLIESFAQAALNEEQALAFAVASSFVSDLITWLTLAALLAAWAHCLKISLRFATALIVTGWAYVPLIFKAPIICYALASKNAAPFLLCLPVLWFFMLQLFAFDAILKIGKVRTFAFIFFAPPVLSAACLFWFLLWAIFAVGQ